MHSKYPVQIEQKMQQLTYMCKRNMYGHSTINNGKTLGRWTKPTAKEAKTSSSNALHKPQDGSARDKAIHSTKLIDKNNFIVQLSKGAQKSRLKDFNISNFYEICTKSWQLMMD